MAKEEEKARTANTSSGGGGGGKAGWFGSLWGQGGGSGGDAANGVEDTSRWAAEEKVIEERQRRVGDLLEDLKPPPRGILTWLQA